MRINLILFSSELHDRQSIMEARRPLFECLGAFSDTNILREEPDEAFIGRLRALPAEKEELTISFIASGGTEEKFLASLPYLPRPLLLLSDGLHNSFAASREIATWLENHHLEYDLIHVPLEITEHTGEELRRQLSRWQDRLSRNRAVAGARLGMLGGASPWLIASGIDPETIERERGIHLLPIGLEEITADYLRRKKEDPEPDKHPLYLRYASLLAEGRTPRQLHDALLLYDTLREACRKYDLDALTVKCFDLLDTCRTTACLALALLNDEGIVSGCEGDLPALYTLLSVYRTEGLPGFMVNPSSADPKERTVDFSHCTIPFSMTSGYTLPSHFESGIGIGIRGELPEGRYTLLKTGGRRLEKQYVCRGTLIPCPYYPQRCRTQVRFRFDTPEEFRNFMSLRAGNHMILVRGEIG